MIPPTLSVDGRVIWDVNYGGRIPLFRATHDKSVYPTC